MFVEYESRNAFCLSISEPDPVQSLCIIGARFYVVHTKNPAQESLILRNLCEQHVFQDSFLTMRICQDLFSPNHEWRLSTILLKNDDCRNSLMQTLISLNR